MSFWSDQRVLVTGGSGFLGSHVVDKLAAQGCAAVLAPRHSDYDLREHADVIRVYRDTSPTLVIHLAAVVGAIDVLVIVGSAGAGPKRSSSFKL